MARFPFEVHTISQPFPLGRTIVRPNSLRRKSKKLACCDKCNGNHWRSLFHRCFKFTMSHSHWVDSLRQSPYLGCSALFPVLRPGFSWIFIIWGCRFVDLACRFMNVACRIMHFACRSWIWHVTSMNLTCHIHGSDMSHPWIWDARSMDLGC